MFSWLWTSNPPSDKTDDNTLEYRLQYKQLSQEAVKKLPQLPYEYEIAKPHVFICRSPAWSFACIITDLDYQFMQYLAASKADLYYGEECFSELLDKWSVCHSSPAHIEEFCELFQVNTIYEGVASANLWDVLIALEPAESLLLDPSLEQVYKDVCIHHEQFYDGTTEVVQAM
jgi:hypothetical protein